MEGTIVIGQTAQLWPSGGQTSEQHQQQQQQHQAMAATPDSNQSSDSRAATGLLSATESPKSPAWVKEEPYDAVVTGETVMQRNTVTEVTPDEEPKFRTVPYGTEGVEQNHHQPWAYPITAVVYGTPNSGIMDSPGPSAGQTSLAQLQPVSQHNLAGSVFDYTHSAAAMLMTRNDYEPTHTYCTSPYEASTAGKIIVGPYAWTADTARTANVIHQGNAYCPPEAPLPTGGIQFYNVAEALPGWHGITNVAEGSQEGGLHQAGAFGGQTQGLLQATQSRIICHGVGTGSTYDLINSNGILLNTGQECIQCGTNDTTFWHRDENTGFYLCHVCATISKSSAAAAAATVMASNSGNCAGGKSSNVSPASCPKGNRKSMSTSKRQGLSCVNCRTTQTTLWRRNQNGDPVCNACGLYFKLHRVNRPISMRKEGIQRRTRKPKQALGKNAAVITGAPVTPAAHRNAAKASYAFMGAVDSPDGQHQERSPFEHLLSGGAPLMHPGLICLQERSPVQAGEPQHPNHLDLSQVKSAAAQWMAGVTSQVEDMMVLAGSAETNTGGQD